MDEHSGEANLPGEEQALRKSERRFITIFQAVPALLAISIPATGQLVEVNEAFLRTIGYRRDEVIGRTTLELGLWADPEDRAQVVAALVDRGSVREVETSFRGRSGEIFTGVLSAKQIEVDSEKYMMVMVQDVTERKRMEEEIRKLNISLAAHTAELEHANREMETFNYSVTHDLRKPLTIINGYCQVILELFGSTLEENCRMYVQKIYEGTLRMNQLIDAQLKFSTVTRTELHYEAVDLSSIAQTVAAELRLTDPERHVTFVLAGNVTVQR